MFNATSPKHFQPRASSKDFTVEPLLTGLCQPNWGMACMTPLHFRLREANLEANFDSEKLEQDTLPLMIDDLLKSNPHFIKSHDAQIMRMKEVWAKQNLMSLDINMSHPIIDSIVMKNKGKFKSLRSATVKFWLKRRDAKGHQQLLWSMLSVFMMHDNNLTEGLKMFVSDDQDERSEILAKFKSEELISTSDGTIRIDKLKANPIFRDNKGWKTLLEEINRKESKSNEADEYKGDVPTTHLQADFRMAFLYPKVFKFNT